MQWQGGRSIQGEEIREKGPEDGGLLNMARTAEMLDHSYFWLSRNYRRLGLKPSKIGGKLLFHREDVFALLKRKRVGVAGRPRLAGFGV